MSSAFIPSRRERPLRCILILFLAFLILLPSRPLSAQSQPQTATYWRYATAGQLQSVLTVDVDRDGLDEFISVDDTHRVALVSIEGNRQWRYRTSTPVETIAAMNVDGADEPNLEIVIGIRNRLILLDANGEVRRQIQIEALPTEDRLEEKVGELNYDPLKIVAYDPEGNGRYKILLLLKTGELVLYDAEGNMLWFHIASSTVEIGTLPDLLTLDFDQDGQQEIVQATFTARRFSQLLYFDGEEQKWAQPLSGRITAMAAVTLDEDAAPLLAVGTNLGHVYLYNADRERVRFRTLNKPITALTAVTLPHGRAFAVGTASGSVIVYDAAGRRIWETHLAEQADRPIISLATLDGPPTREQPALIAMLAADETSADAADVIVLGSNGQKIAKYNAVDPHGLTTLIDSNHDGNRELLTTQFSSFEVSGFGVSNNQNIQGWETPFSLESAPSAILSADFDGDQDEELIIGTQNGHIYSLRNDRSTRWLHVPGGSITHLGLLAGGRTQAASFVTARSELSETDGDSTTGWLERRDQNGEKEWAQAIPAPITALLILDNPQPEIVVAAENGTIYLYDWDGNLASSFTIPNLRGHIQQLLLQERRNGRQTELVVVTDKQIFALSRTNPERIKLLATYNDAIQAVYPIPQPGLATISVSLLVLAGDGLIHGLNWEGQEMSPWGWPYQLDAKPIMSLSSNQLEFGIVQANETHLLIGTEEGDLIRFNILNNQPNVVWQLPGFSPFSSLHWQDQNSTGEPDVVFVGNENGQATILLDANSERPQLQTSPINLASPIFAISPLSRDLGNSPDLLIITENGLVQLFREQQNRPPMLMHSRPEVQTGQYTLSVLVRDVEGDSVLVELEVQDPESGEWLSQGGKRVDDGNGRLFWSLVNLPENPEGLNYRFHYQELNHQGYLTPPIGPAPILQSPIVSVLPTLSGVLGITGLLALIVYIRQSRRVDVSARRFYRRVKNRPTLTLPLLAEKYAQKAATPDFLLHLANRARQVNDQTLGSLADALFLLPNRPRASVAILLRTLKYARQSGAEWRDVAEWQLLYSTCATLLNAPSTTEISLLQPQLDHLLHVAPPDPESYTSLQTLQPVVMNIYDSERVEQTDDRLVYLNEAALRLGQAREYLPELEVSIERTLAYAIAQRWDGLLSAEIADLRGRAELVIELKTKRLVPAIETDIAIEIKNIGRSPAENIIAVLEDNLAYEVSSAAQIIPFLPAGRTRQLHFTIKPTVTSRFRIAVNIAYDDRNQHDKKVAFGDMVHMLRPIRKFSPIKNPYMPGTPLRSDNILFFGRKALFDFISENTGYQRSHRNVMILIGQRRTGKTSALLRLGNYLPDHLLSVYIDCQSLGVIPGMPALLQEFAWHIADGLALRDIEIEVPPIEQWQDDPTQLFQRRFLKEVMALLPSNTTLLLVFDEFEAFESLVKDHILPPTFFTYLRHLMQHDDRLNFIFVGTRRLEEMSADYWSVLFNIALYQKIDFLNEPAAIRLITEPVQPELIYDDLALDKVWRVTAGHPYFLQLVCYTLVKHANLARTGYVTISDVNAALDEMLRLGELHFAYLWQRSGFAEKALLTAVANLMDRNNPFHTEDLLHYLEAYNIHIPHAEANIALNRLVERDILREITESARSLYELKLGLVGHWVAKNKSLSRLHVSRL